LLAEGLQQWTGGGAVDIESVVLQRQMQLQAGHYGFLSDY
jgi:hypothetical protein